MFDDIRLINLYSVVYVTSTCMVSNKLLPLLLYWLSRFGGDILGEYQKVCWTPLFSSVFSESVHLHCSLGGIAPPLPWKKRNTLTSLISQSSGFQLTVLSATSIYFCEVIVSLGACGYKTCGSEWRCLHMCMCVAYLHVIPVTGCWSNYCSNYTH